jgi:hypothetical protein
VIQYPVGPLLHRSQPAPYVRHEPPAALRATRRGLNLRGRRTSATSIHASRHPRQDRRCRGPRDEPRLQGKVGPRSDRQVSCSRTRKG